MRIIPFVLLILTMSGLVFSFRRSFAPIPKVFSNRLRYFSSLDPSLPPSKPINYHKDFVVPPYDSKLELEQRNGHHLDALLAFDEPTHHYTFDGNLMKYSVTQFVSSFFHPFEEDKIIDAMMNSASWPRPNYVDKDGITPLTKEQIKFRWSSGRKIAANYGTWLHYNIERYFNGLVRRMYLLVLSLSKKLLMLLICLYRLMILLCLK